MLIFKKIDELRACISTLKASGKTLGFVPTMGALHQGHISLIASSKKRCDVTICSIFVNPTQFNDPKDLERYPRMPEKDAAMLEQAGCDILFLPEVAEMYPEGAQKEDFDFGYLDKILEGSSRPGHFAGVAQIVKRFFEIITPDVAFFGSKDYQQVMIVKALVKQMRSSIEIVPCPILREPDGLAMSSRNALLSAHERLAAGRIPGIMQAAKEIVLQQDIAAAKAYVEQEIALQPLMKPVYFEVCDADTLQILASITPGQKAVALIAVFVGKIRLIDNLALN